MEPEDKYLKQAEILFNIIEQIKSGEYEEEDYKKMLIVICEKYYAHLIALAVFSPLINTKLISVKSLESKPPQPPFEKDFFNNHPM